MPGYTTLSLADTRTVSYDTGAEWLPLRADLGVGAFGLNAWRAAKGQEVIERHDELDGDSGPQEVYLVVEGAARFTVGGDDIPAPAGTIVFIEDPALERVAVAEADGTLVLAIGAEKGKAFGALGVGAERAHRAWMIVGGCGYQPTTMIHHRHYTVDDANRQLAVVGKIVQRIRDARGRLADEEFDSAFSTCAELTGGAYPGPEHAAAALEVALGFDRLEELDVVVRDLERGLIDFPSLLGGEEVYLCWLLGEPSVGHWHGVEGGFAGRQPIE